MNLGGAIPFSASNVSKAASTSSSNISPSKKKQLKDELDSIGSEILSAMGVSAEDDDFSAFSLGDSIFEDAGGNDVFDFGYDA